MFSLFMAFTTCVIGPIECQIKKNMPMLSDEYVRVVSRAIYNASYEHGVPGRIYTAILMQESNYRIGAKACNKYGCDYGIAQINEKTIEAYGMDKDRLMYDLSYSVEMGAKVLSWFRKTYEAKEPEDWFLRYNCGTKKSLKRKTCQEYKRKVRRWL